MIILVKKLVIAEPYTYRILSTKSAVKMVTSYTDLVIRS